MLSDIKTYKTVVTKIMYFGTMLDNRSVENPEIPEIDTYGNWVSIKVPSQSKRDSEVFWTDLAGPVRNKLHSIPNH